MAKGNRIKAGGKVFRDPVHQLIRIDPEDEVILALIDTREFQRLRRIRQLGVSSMTYHGADHSRFAHSLGVFNFAQRILDVLARRYRGDKAIARMIRQESRSVKIAALLHDIGHGPFSHLFESLFKSLPGDSSTDQKQLGHEERSREIGQSGLTEVGRLLCSCEAEVIAIADLICGVYGVAFAQDIIASQLDADRMDYLLRDSHATGVKYGKYDVDWLLHTMCLGGRKKPLNKMKLCLSQAKGRYGGDRFVFARQHMYQQVYMHRVTRGYEQLLKNVFLAASYAVRDGGLPGGTPEPVRAYLERSGRVDLELFLRLDDSLVWAALSAWAESSGADFETLNDLAAGFLNRRNLYRAAELTEQFGVEDSGRLKARLEEVEKEKDGKTPTYVLDEASSTVYKGIRYQESHRLRDRDDPDGPMSILLADESNPEDCERIELRSSPVDAVDAQRDDIRRLYFRRSLEERYKPIIQEFKLRLCH